jgi:hypothetical protein
MKDNVLKKEFKFKDVQRARNLIQGKVGDKTGLSVGYNKKDEFHEEGDIWEVDGRKWTIKDGIKQNITKLDKVKKLHMMPLFCPNCSKIMKNKFDKDYYNIHKKCFECVVDFEHELKKTGLYEAYSKKIHNSEIDSWILQFKDYITSELSQTNTSFITESGDVEKWVGGPDKKRVLEHLDKTIEHLEKMKK